MPHSYTSAASEMVLAVAPPELGPERVATRRWRSPGEQRWERDHP
jgi:hypothetical protein